MLHPPSLPRWDQFTTVADCQGPWADYRRLLTAADYYRGFPCDAAHRLYLAVGLCVCTPVSRVCIKGFPYAVWLSLPVVFITHLCYGSRARRTVLTRVRLGASLATQHVDPRGGTGAFTPVSAYLAPQLSSSQECNTLELHAQQDIELQAQNIDEIS